jgi:hypothetical protein
VNAVADGVSVNSSALGGCESKNPVRRIRSPLATNTPATGCCGGCCERDGGAVRVVVTVLETVTANERSSATSGAKLGVLDAVTANDLRSNCLSERDRRCSASR